MSERKVLNKYYPPDFDPSKIPKLKLPKDRQYVVRLMAPFNMRCKTCGEYIYKGKKFNARKETVQNEVYLGLPIFRFYIKCTRCLAEITFKTDPENTDYTMEHGATRNFQAEKLLEEEEKRVQKEREDEELNNPMKVLENRTKDSKLEMEVLENLQELKDLNQRQAHVDFEAMLRQHRLSEEERQKQEQEEDERETEMDKFSKDIESSHDEFYFESEERSEKWNSDESEFSEDASGDDDQIAGPSGTTERKTSLALPIDLAERPDSDRDIEFMKAKRRRTIVYWSESDGDLGDIIEKSGVRPSASHVSRGKQEKAKWTSTSSNDKEPSRVPFSTGQLHVGPQVPPGCATPVDFFQLFFTETLIKNLTDETNEYARHKISQKELSQRSTGNTWKDVTIEEMKAFLGVILNMGVLNHPNLQSYWSMDFESHTPFFRSVFKRERFLQIFCMLHLKNDQKSSEDLRTRTEKVNCFLSYLEMKFRDRFCPGREMAAHEAAVGFKGKIRFITYNPKKPTKRVFVYMSSQIQTVVTYIHLSLITEE
ncbi:splicing factor YJU2 isoform X1 [Microcebus murinus]|nr:coiled-coil domain-containing protein 94 isoform X1 [Microcebus murinus]